MRMKWILSLTTCVVAVSFIFYIFYRDQLEDSAEKDLEAVDMPYDELSFEDQRRGPVSFHRKKNTGKNLTIKPNVKNSIEKTDPRNTSADSAENENSSKSKDPSQPDDLIDDLEGFQDSLYADAFEWLKRIDPKYYAPLTKDNIYLIKTLNLSNQKVTDRDLGKLRNMSYLTTLILSNTDVSDAGLAELKNFPALKNLYLSNTKVTDLGLKQLSKMNYLKELTLSGTAVTDDGMSSLAQMTNLTFLSLGKTSVGDKGLLQLSNLRQMQRFAIYNTKITDKGLEALVFMAKLNRLDLSQNKLSNSCLNTVARFEAMVNLSMNFCPINDEGLESLYKLNSLSHLGLHGTQTTSQGRSDLKQMLPQLKTKYN